MSVSSQGFILYRPLSRRRSKIKKTKDTSGRVDARRHREASKKRRYKRDATLDRPGTGLERPSAAFIDFKKIERSDLRIYRGGDLPMGG